MPSKPPPPPPKGSRHPGAGRKKGTPNRITVEARTLVSQLVSDPNYQHHLRSAFRRRKLHPTIESLIWQFHIGKPVAAVTIQGSMALDVTGKLEEERHVFAQLDVSQLLQLQAESQALLDRARAWTQAKTPETGTVNPLTPQDVVIEAEGPKDPTEMLRICGGSDNESYVNSTENLDNTKLTPDPPTSYAQGKHGTDDDA